MSDNVCLNCGEKICDCSCGETEVISNNGPTCPYCGHTAEGLDNEAYDVMTESWTCGSCGKEYTLDVHTSTSWTSHKMEKK